VEERAGRVKRRRWMGRERRRGRKEAEWGCAPPETKSWLRHCGLGLQVKAYSYRAGLSA